MKKKTAVRDLTDVFPQFRISLCQTTIHNHHIAVLKQKKVHERKARDPFKPKTTFGSFWSCPTLKQGTHSHRENKLLSWRVTKKKCGMTGEFKTKRIKIVFKTVQKQQQKREKSIYGFFLVAIRIEWCTKIFIKKKRNPLSDSVSVHFNLRNAVINLEKALSRVFPPISCCYFECLTEFISRKNTFQLSHFYF